ncbi:MAG: hypothetical protein Q9201_004034 [Fulgogasparrea decipioides]
MNQAFNDPSTTLWKVFKAYFAEKYSLGPKPRRSAWESMRNYIAHEARYRKSWTEAIPARLKVKLVRIASLVGIRLQPKLYKASPASIHRRWKRTPSPELSSSSASEVEWDSGGDPAADENSISAAANLDPAISPINLQARHAMPSSGLLTPPSSQTKYPASTVRRVRPDRPVPPIAFRAFNEHSQGLNGADGFVAGSFIDATSIQGISNERFYLDELERHLARQCSGSTPFISVSQDLLRVIHHTVRRTRDSDNDQPMGWKVAVINLSRVPGSVRAVWDLDAGPESGKAFHEWVVWGSIPSSNILNVLSIDELLGLMSQSIQTFHVDMIKEAKWTGEARKVIQKSVKRELTYIDGLKIGELLQLLRVPSRHLNHVTHTVLAGWRYPERRRRAWESNLEFVRGRDEAYQLASSDFLALAGNIGEAQGSELELSELIDVHSRTDPVRAIRDVQSSYHKAGRTYQDTSDINWFISFLTEMEDTASGPWNPQPGLSLPSGGVIEVVNDDPRTGFVVLEKGSPGPLQPGMALSGRYCVKEVNDDADTGFIWLKRKSTGI